MNIVTGLGENFIPYFSSKEYGCSTSSGFSSKTLNIFQQFLRRFLGWYKETHIATVAKDVCQVMFKNPFTEDQRVLKVIAVAQDRKILLNYSPFPTFPEKGAVRVDYVVRSCCGEDGKKTLKSTFMNLMPTGQDRGQPLASFSYVQKGAASDRSPRIIVTNVISHDVERLHYAVLSRYSDDDSFRSAGADEINEARPARPKEVAVFWMNVFLQKLQEKEGAEVSIVTQRRKTAPEGLDSTAYYMRLDAHLSHFGFTYKEEVLDECVMVCGKHPLIREYVYDKSCLPSDLQGKINGILQSMRESLKS